MPRKPRYFLSGVPVHLVQRGHCRGPVFFESKDYAAYAYWLKESGQRYEIEIHAFVLMTNHVHLLVTPKVAENISLFMQFIGRRYVPYINHKYGKSGTLWEGRFKSSLVHAEEYFLSVMRYIELNPVRAGMISSPSEYRWSSYCHNVNAREISFISAHPVYTSLGNNKLERAECYRALFTSHIDERCLKKINDAWQTGTPLGGDRFRKHVEKQLAKKVGQARRGRPWSKGE